MRKDANSPTLGTYDPHEKRNFGNEPLFDCEEQRTKWVKALIHNAFYKAFQLHKEVYNTKGSFYNRKDHDAFFDDNEARGDPERRVINKRSASKVLKVGTDCSGMEAPIQALHNLDAKFEHLFSCDNDPKSRQTILANFPPKEMYEDITTRVNANTPCVDLYVAGFPCQPFSTAGKQQGFDDVKGRGNIFYDVLDYIDTRRPKVFILENVKGLTTLQQGKCLRKILAALHGIKEPGATHGSAYEIHHEVLNTKDHRVPQNRPRWYCVGIRKDTFVTDKSSFHFPDVDPSYPSIEFFLDNDRLGATHSQSIPEQPSFQGLTNTARHNITKARSLILSKGHNPDEQPYIVDCDASTSKSKHICDLSPCITRSRHQGHWITNRNRRMTIYEMFRLQGMDHTQFIVAPGVTIKDLGQQLGNAMSVNVIERVILQALNAANLEFCLGRPNAKDRWANGEALQQLQQGIGKPFKNFTDPVPPGRFHERIIVPFSSDGREYLLDSGASWHSISWRNLSAKERKTKRRLPEPLSMFTANGFTQVEFEIQIDVNILGMKVWALLMDDTPTLISIGHLCNSDGFDFIWKNCQVPYLQRGEFKLFCYPSCNIPRLFDHEQQQQFTMQYSPQTPTQDNEVLPTPPLAQGDLQPLTSTPTPSLQSPIPASQAKEEVPEPVSLTPTEVLRGTESGGGDDGPGATQGAIPKVKLSKEEKLAKAKEARKQRSKDKRKAKKKKVTCQTCEHNIFTHFPKDPNCEICQLNKSQKAYCKSKAEPQADALPEPVMFGDAITADHKIINDDDDERETDNVAYVIQDRASFWLQAYAALTKGAEEIKKAFQRFLGPDGTCKHVYTDNSKEQIKAFEDLGLSHDTSTPHRPETNGIAERAVRRVKEGTSCTLAQSGFGDEWWAHAMVCFCFLRNVVDILLSGHTAYFGRFGVDYTGPTIPFGAEIEYQPSSQKDIKRLHSMAHKTLPGIFLGYVQHAGGGWSGDVNVLDWEELDKADYVSQCNIRRFKAEEVHAVKPGGKFIFPLAEGDLRQPGDEQAQYRRSIRQRRKRKEREARGDPEPPSDVPHTQEPFPTQEEAQHDAQHDPPTAITDFWTCNSDCIIRHHKVPRTQLFVPTNDDLPLPLKYVDILRTTETDLEHLREHVVRDYWTRDGARELSAPWTGRTVFTLLKPQPPPGFTWVMGRLTRKQKTTRPDSIRPEEWSRLGTKDKAKQIQDWEVERTARDEERAKRGITEVSKEDEQDYQDSLERAIAQHNISIAPCMPVMPMAMLLQRFTETERPGATLGEEMAKMANAALEVDSQVPEVSVSEESMGRPNAYEGSMDGTQRRHQERIASAGTSSTTHYAMVHKPIPLPVAMRIPEAREALDAEWTKLEKFAWDLAGVKPRAEVEARARTNGIKIHFGDVMALCHLKNSELRKELQRYKGRIVFRGDGTRDEDGFYAVFSEQGTSQSHMASTKFLDVIGQAPGNDGEDADAIGAFTQMKLSEAARLLGEQVIPETWITLPKSRQPASWAGIKDPVCPLIYNLYGHPLAGLLWDKGSQEKILRAGFEKVKGWESLYVHKPKQLFLGVYVDDFHMAGKQGNLAPMWAHLRANGLDLDKPVNFNGNTYLGCTQHNVEVPQDVIEDKTSFYNHITRQPQPQPQPLEPLRDAPTEQVVPPKSKRDKGPSLGRPMADTPSPQVIAPIQPRATSSTPPKPPKVRAWEYKMTGAAEQCVERYMQLAKVSRDTLRKVATPCIDDHLLAPEDFINKGVLAPVCAKIVLKALYLSRLARPDLFWTVNALAREVTRWNVACDKRLHRLISYIEHTKQYTMTSFIGDELQDCLLMLFCDASFAGDLVGSKSTSGALLCVVGPRTFCPITWLCKKQGAVSHSSTEAEVIAMDAALRLEGIPAIQLWGLIQEVFGTNDSGEARGDPVAAQPKVRTANDMKGLPDEFKVLMEVDYVPTNMPELNTSARLIILEDNDAVIKMCIKARSPNMRHVTRTHRVDLDWLFERILTDPAISIRYVNTKEQLADIFTKGSFTEQTWQVLCRLLQIGVSHARGNP